MLILAHLFSWIGYNVKSASVGNRSVACPSIITESHLRCNLINPHYYY